MEEMEGRPAVAYGVLAALQDTSIDVEGDTVHIRDPLRLAADSMPDPLIDDAEEP